MLSSNSVGINKQCQFYLISLNPYEAIKQHQYQAFSSWHEVICSPSSSSSASSSSKSESSSPSSPKLAFGLASNAAVRNFDEKNGSETDRMSVGVRVDVKGIHPS